MTNLLGYPPFHADNYLNLQEKNGISSCRIYGLDIRQTIENKARYRIRGMGGGWAFSPRDFLGLLGRSTVDSALHRMEKQGEIRRVIRGIYDYPAAFSAEYIRPAVRLKMGRLRPGNAGAVGINNLHLRVDG